MNPLKITTTKGRPMLRWVGKKPLEYIRGFPVQLVEIFDPLNNIRQIKELNYENLEANWHNLLFHGENKDVLATLLEKGFRGKVNLIYIDPPFSSNKDYVRKVQLRGLKNLGEMEEDNVSVIQQTMYEDMWKKDEYFQFMYERLILLKELLNDKGVIYLHCDHREQHHLRLILDEVFGEDNFLNTISWRSQVPRGAKVDAFYYPYSTHYIHIYAKNKEAPPTWHPPKKQMIISQKEAEKEYFKDNKGYFRTSDPGSYSYDSLKKLYKEGRIYVSKGGKVFFDDHNKTVKTDKGTIGIKYYITKLDENRYLVEKAVDNLWDDIPGLGTVPHQDTGYVTQKTEHLLNRIIKTSTNPGDLVLDCFIGSGTTAVVAQKLGRKWIGCDINKGAIQTTSKRLQEIKKSSFPSFAIYKVNNYDLKLLQTEAIELAIQHIGIQRTRTDRFFDGTLGKNLVKIIDFNHPLTLLDLQLLQDELKKRPEEDRDITIVCLGKEVAIDPWVEEWNKKHPVNKIKVIELRTDKKYGNFLIQKPAEAEIDIKRKNNKVLIEIQDFISPTIIERLNIDNKLFRLKIPDFRSMIDYVLIDTNYDGNTFHIVYSDVPEKKNDFIKGKYEIEIFKKKTKVAVKVIDMLGEEVLFVKEI